MIKSPNVLVLLILVLAIPAFGQEVKVVVSEGVGSDPQSAAQNAAQNALTQVVGSFIDADTQLKKRTEVQNGIRSEAKQINRSIREYSQGSISSFEILETSQDGQLFRVSAKVGVRLAEFKAYIAKLAEGESRVGAGLFAEVKTATSQSQSLKDLISERLQLIADGKVQEFIVGKPIPYSRSKFSKTKLPESGESDDRWLNDFLRNGGDAASLIVVPVISRLKGDFFENLLATLRNTAADRKRWSCSNVGSYTIPGQAQATCLRDGEGFWGYGVGEGKLSIAIPDKARWSSEFGVDVYKLALGRAQVFGSLKVEPFLFFGGQPGKFPQLRVSIHSNSNEELFSLSSRLKPMSGRGQSLKGGFFLDDENGEEPPWFMLTPKNKLDIIVRQEKSFHIVFPVDPEKLKNAESIKISIEQ